MAKNKIIIGCLLLLNACVQPYYIEPESSSPLVILDTIETVIHTTDTLKIPCPEEETVQKFLQILKGYTGVKETTGRNDGPEIKAMLETCGLGEGNPWCAAMIAKALDSLNLAYPELCAWSPAYFTDPTRIVWERKIERSKIIPAGSVFGLYYESKGRIAHVGVILYDTNRGYVVTLEGNTNAGGSRDGNMAAVRMRRKSQIFMAANWLD